MWAQQAQEIKKIKATAYAPPPETLVCMLPPTQQKMITTGVIVAQPGEILKILMLSERSYCGSAV
jgi:hypothetical protein